MPTAHLTILLVTDDACTVHDVAEACERFQAGACRIVVLPDLQEPDQRTAPWHLAVLDVERPGTESAWKRLADVEPRVPVVALASAPAERQELRERGALAVLLRHPLDGSALVTVLDRLNGRGPSLDDEGGLVAGPPELDALSALGADATRETERSMGLERFSRSKWFTALAQRYRASLSAAIRAQAYADGPHDSVDDELEGLAGTLGYHLAGPRDVIDLHTRVLRQALAESPAAQRSALVDEGRIALVRLLGHLVSYYRSRAVPVAAPVAARPSDDDH